MGGGVKNSLNFTFKVNFQPQKSTDSESFSFFFSLKYINLGAHCDADYENLIIDHFLPLMFIVLGTYL